MSEKKRKAPIPRVSDKELLQIEFDHYMTKRNRFTREIADCKHDSDLANEELEEHDEIFTKLKKRAEKLGMELGVQLVAQEKKDGKAKKVGDSSPKPSKGSVE